ncbi:MAG: EAL domain-containing protein [Anaerolineae bacterium]|nr:EAL domain-containing protein [Gloeobacterales cyanobacterium ES-bin-313]
MTAHILLVDDDPVQRKILRKCLSGDNYKISEAVDGLSAWELVKQQPPDLVISDWNMPGMTGVELCRALRQFAPSRYSYVMLLTARDDTTSLQEGLETGADEYLTKPIQGADLRVRVKAGLRQFHDRCTLHAVNAQLASLVTTDPLTGVGNRRALDSRLQHLVAQAGMPLSILVVDCDHFKRVNDNHGHLIGDEVLVGCVNRLYESLRYQDQLFRYGGEEFVIVLYNSDLEKAGQVGERLCVAMQAKPIETTKGELPLTISIGIAMAMPDEKVAGLLARADDALYLAKRGGRNQAVIAEHRSMLPGRMTEAPPNGFWGFYLFDPEGQISELADALQVYCALKVIDEVTLRSNEVCEFQDIEEIYHLLARHIRPERLKHIRIRGAKSRRELDSPVASALQSTSIEQFLFEHDVRQLLEAPDRPSLYPVFQPIFDLRDGSCMGHEALLRGRAIDGSEVGAGRIFAYIENSKKIHEFDELARVVHLDSISQLQPKGLVFLNLIPTTLEKTDEHISKLLNAIELVGRPLDQYVLEVTTAHQQSVEQLQAILRRYQKAGFVLALDDLGASSVPLSGLIDLKPGFAKIDRSLIDNVDTDPGRQLLVKTLTDLAHIQGIQVIAEGIERQAELEFCKTIGVDYAQGFLLGRPNEVPFASSLPLKASQTLQVSAKVHGV